MPNDGVDDLVGATGIGKEFGEHGAQRNEDSDASRGVAETLCERGQYGLQVLPRDDADRECTEEQREEWMQLDDGDQYDDHRDTREEGQDQLPARGHRFGELRCVVSEERNTRDHLELLIGAG